MSLAFKGLFLPCNNMNRVCATRPKGVHKGLTYIAQVEHSQLGQLHSLIPVKSIEKPFCLVACWLFPFIPVLPAPPPLLFNGSRVEMTANDIQASSDYKMLTNAQSVSQTLPQTHTRFKAFNDLSSSPSQRNDRPTIPAMRWLHLMVCTPSPVPDWCLWIIERTTRIYYVLLWSRSPTL